MEAAFALWKERKPAGENEDEEISKQLELIKKQQEEEERRLARERQEDEEMIHDAIELTIADSSSTPSSKAKKRKGYQISEIKPRQHFSWFAYGRLMTVLAIALTVTAFSTSFLAIDSFHFVELKEPLVFPNLKNMSTLGLVWLEICADNETEFTNTANETAIAIGEQVSDHVENHESYTRQRLLTANVLPTEGCDSIRLTAEMVNDTTWNAARCFAALAVMFGGFFTLFVCLSAFWESVNLRPVSLGLLFTYFFQSISFLFFNSDICKQFGCGLEEGSVFSIVASVMWFVGGLVVIRMDVTYRTKQHILESHQRRQEERREQRQQEEESREEYTRELEQSKTKSLQKRESTMETDGTDYSDEPTSIVQQLGTLIGTDDDMESVASTPSHLSTSSETQPGGSVASGESRTVPQGNEETNEEKNEETSEIPGISSMLSYLGTF